MIDLPELPAPIEKMVFYVKRRKDGVFEIWAQPRVYLLNSEHDQVFITACGDRGAAELALGELRRIRALTEGLMR